MRLLISSLATHGHTYPLLPFGIVARAAGHEVRYAVAASFHPVVERLGFTPVPIDGGEIGPAFAEVFAAEGRDLRDRGSMRPEQIMPMAARVFGEVLPRQVAGSLAPVLAADPPDLVVHEVGNLGSRCGPSRSPSPGSCRPGRPSPARRWST